MKKLKSKQLIALISIILVVAIIVPIVVIAIVANTTPIKFLMKKDLSEYVDINVPGSLNYGEMRESLVAGYDLFRVGITEAYLGNCVYVEEGSTMDFKLSAELVTETESGVKEYTAIEMPEEYATVEGYRPYSKSTSLFFDKALAEVGDKDESGIDYMERDKSYKFTVTMPEEERFGEYAGKKIRFTIVVTDYVARYVYIYNGGDNSIGIIGDWYCKVAMGLTTPTANTTEAVVEEGDIILYDCIDTFTDGSTSEYLDTYMEVTSEYMSYFGGRKVGEVFTEEFTDVSEKITIKAIYKLEDIETAIAARGYASAYALREELRIWCYAVYSDGIISLVSKNVELVSYPKDLMNTYMKLEDQTWETEFRESALSMATSFGDEIALDAYEITGFDTMQAYLDDLVADHVETLVRELVICYSYSKHFDILDSLYERYNKSVEDYMEAQKFSSRREALETLSANGDEACIFYTNFLSPILGTKFAELVEGANFTEFLKDSYLN